MCACAFCCHNDVKNWSSYLWCVGTTALCAVFNRLSIRVLVSEAANESKRNDQQIECHGPGTDVIKLILNALCDGRITAPTVNLGPTCYAHFQIVAAIVIAHRPHELLHQRRALRSGTDNTHLALEYIEKLRQLVETCFPQDFAYSSTPWIALYCPTRITLFC